MNAPINNRSDIIAKPMIMNNSQSDIDNITASHDSLLNPRHSTKNSNNLDINQTSTNTQPKPPISTTKTAASMSIPMMPLNHKSIDQEHNTQTDQEKDEIAPLIPTITIQATSPDNPAIISTNEHKQSHDTTQNPLDERLLHELVVYGLNEDGSKLGLSAIIWSNKRH